MVYCGDCLDVLATLDANSVHAVVTDPPYDLVEPRASRNFLSGSKGRPRTEEEKQSRRGFMGQSWDGTGVAFQPATWAAVARVMRPGAYLLAFGGTRTYHRMTCAIEDAGFIIRDCIMWIHGQGFPKSHNLDGGLGTALKPAYEPIVLAQKPLDGTYATNVQKWGCGALNIDRARIGMSQTDADFIRKTARPNSAGHEHIGTVMNRPATPTVNVHAAGRWPANITLDEEAAALLDEQAGPSVARPVRPENIKRSGDGQARGLFGMGSKVQTGYYDLDVRVSRFFFVAKPSRAERERGLMSRTAQRVNDGRMTPIDNPYQRGETERVNTHPTVKATALMRHLLTLAVPPGGTVLDPFMGSGSTGVAAVELGIDFIGIEKEQTYMDIAVARITDAELRMEAATVLPLFDHAGIAL